MKLPSTQQTVHCSRFISVWLCWRDVGRLVCASKTGCVMSRRAVCRSSPGLAKISFTGSTTTGRHIMAEAAKKGIPTCMELGGKSCLIVFEDADVEDAVEWAMVRRLPYPVSLRAQCCNFSRFAGAPSIRQSGRGLMKDGVGTACLMQRCLRAVWLLLDEWADLQCHLATAGARTHCREVLCTAEAARRGHQHW